MLYGPYQNRAVALPAGIGRHDQIAADHDQLGELAEIEALAELRALQSDDPMDEAIFAIVHESRNVMTFPTAVDVYFLELSAQKGTGLAVSITRGPDGGSVMYHGVFPKHPRGHYCRVIESDLGHMQPVWEFLG